MVALPQPFDARNVAPSSGYSPLPNGWYLVVIVASELKPTKANDGQFLQFDRKVIDAEDRQHIGKTFPQRLNVYNKSEQAMQIAQSEFSAICHVTGCMLVDNTAMLHNIPHRVRLELSYNDQGKPVGNDVREYADQHGNPPSRAGSGGSAPVSPAGTHSAMAQPQPQQQAPAPVQQAPVQPAPQAGGWGAPAGQQQQPAPQQPTQPQQAGGWGNPATPAANPTGFGGAQPARQAPQQASGAPAWGAPPPNGAPQQPAAWGRPN